MTAKLFLSTAVLLHLVAGIIVSTPPKAKPVIFGTSDYSNVLFGKIQRAASLFGTNLGQPLSVLSEGDSLSKLDKCLWNKFCMANCGSSGVEEEEDIKLPLTSWIPNGNLTGAIIFLDAASCISSGGEGGGNPLANLFSFRSKNKRSSEDSATQPTASATINEGLLAVAVARNCAHVYVLSDDASLSNCISTLERCANDIPCTILALESKVALVTTKGWTSSRPQDLEGELTGPVTIQSMNLVDEPPSIAMSTTTFPVEDAAEVMLQVALRTDRAPEKRLRVVRLKAGGELQERLNADYFTMVGGKKARSTAGTVQSVSSWESVLSPSFGPVIGSLGINKR